MLPLLLTLVVAPQSVRVTQPAERAQPERVSGAEQLSRLAEDLVPTFFARYPWLAYERRYPQPSPLAFADYGIESFIAWRDRLGDLRSRMNAIPERELDESSWVVYEASAAWLRAQELSSFGRSLERWDATSYVDRVEETIFGLTRSEYIPAHTRWLRAVGVLEGLPSYWDTARESLVSPSQFWNNEAVGRLVELGLALEADLPRAFENLRLEKRDARRMETAVREAVEATDRFRVWLLGTRAPRGEEAGVMDGATWESLMQVVSGSALTAADLKTELLRDIAGMNLHLGGDWEPRPASGSGLDPRRLSRATQTASELAASLAERSGLFRQEAVPLLSIEVHEGRSTPRPLTRLWPGKGLTDTLHIETGTLSWSPEVRETRATLLNARALATLGIRYGWAGEAKLRHAATTAQNPVARFLWNRSVFEGWGLYALDWIQRIDWRENPFLGDENLEDEIVRAWLLEAVRLLASIEIHVEGLSVTAAADAFRRRSRFDPETAMVEARRAHHDPMYGIGYVGLMELRLLEETLGREVTGREALQETLRTVLANPHLRPFDLRNRLGAQRPR